MVNFRNMLGSCTTQIKLTVIFRVRVGLDIGLGLVLG